MREDRRVAYVARVQDAVAAGEAVERLRAHQPMGVGNEPDAQGASSAGRSTHGRET
jgi:hypothetical protein